MAAALDKISRKGVLNARRKTMDIESTLNEIDEAETRAIQGALADSRRYVAHLGLALARLDEAQQSAIATGERDQGTLFDVGVETADEAEEVAAEQSEANARGFFAAEEDGASVTFELYVDLQGRVYLLDRDDSGDVVQAGGPLTTHELQELSAFAPLEGDDLPGPAVEYVSERLNTDWSDTALQYVLDVEHLMSPWNLDSIDDLLKFAGTPLTGRRATPISAPPPAGEEALDAEQVEDEDAEDDGESEA